MPGIYREVDIRTLFRGDRAHPRHSEASVIELRDGSLLMAWQRFESRRDGEEERGSNDHAPANICLADSCDGGRSWHNIRVAAVCPPGTVNLYSPNFLRLQNGDIQLLYKNYVQLDIGLPVLATAYTIQSGDEGRTFSQPRPVWEREPFGFSNHCIHRTPSGRVLLPVQICHGEIWSPTEHITVGLMVSDDDCRTWRRGGQEIDLPMRGAMEPFIADVHDGRLIMVMRTQLGSVFKSYSADDGLSWSKPQTTGLRTPESCPCITNIPNSRKLLVIWNNAEYDMQLGARAAGYGKRTPLTAAVTADGGNTFTDFWDIETYPTTAFSNPAVTWARGGRCILTYWATPYTEDWQITQDHYMDLKLASFYVDA